ncbi:MAG: 50S ribosomal protein L9 [Flavobacteriales bacterium]|nr:50S ribosomal protein L9 [Flavobacteriales bacterium]
MKVILKEDVSKLGYKNEVVEVRNGYGRNYLIPQGIAVLATSSNLKVLAENIKQTQRKQAAILAAAEDTAKALEGMTLTIGTKAGSNGKIFGSVTTIQIAHALKEKGHDIDRKKIAIANDIKELGDYTAKVYLHRGVEAAINLSVISE